MMTHRESVIDRDNLHTCEVWQLLDMARTAGLRYMHIPGLASQVLVCGARTPESDRIAVALHARVEEVAQILPYPTPFAERADERDYREDVLREPDIPLGDLPIPVAKAMIVRWVLDVLEAERDNEEWAQATAGRNALPRATVGRTEPPVPAMPSIGLEFRGGRVVRR